MTCAWPPQKSRSMGTVRPPSPRTRPPLLRFAGRPALDGLLRSAGRSRRLAPLPREPQREE
uniref:Uncharacterized protein n=1 Tax=Oryza meridionalis TaxID=40149 RepID=A0A0E0F4H5_9ORYZ